MSVSPRRIAAAVFLLIALGLAARFVHLDADFPPGLTWSGVLYTDEGWYANAAARDARFGDWYQDGDFNPAVNMPVGQVLQRASFALFGVGLVPARITSAVAMLAIVGLAGWLAWRHHGARAAALAMGLLATNFTLFAYSRLGIMELPATALALAGIVVIAGAREPGAARWLAGAGLVALGILTKSTMLCAVPVLLYLGWRQAAGWRARARVLAAPLGLVALLVGGWHLWARATFPVDYAYFNAVNVAARANAGFGDWLVNLPRVAMRVANLGLGFGALILGAVLLAAWRVPAYRRLPVVWISGVMVLAYLGVLSLVSHGPPRYYLPLAVPLALAGAVAAVELARLGPAWGRGLAVALVLVVGVDLARIGVYLARPQYSFVTMAHEVGRRIAAREGAARGVTLVGATADSVGLETGTRALNPNFGTVPSRERIAVQRPRYLLLHADVGVLREVEAAGGRSERLGTWDVFGNYYGKGYAVVLYAVTWPESRPQPGPRPGAPR